MSSEVCPFCGNTYKRLKSHLPHCKAAPRAQTPPAKTPPTTRHVTAKQTSSSSQRDVAEGRKSTHTSSTGPRRETGTKASASSSEPPQPSTPASSSPLTSSSLSSTSLPVSTKKKKQKLAREIEAIALSTSSSPPPPPPPPPAASKPKKKSLRALIEAASQVRNGSLEGTRAAAEDPPSVSALRSRITAETETKTNRDKDGARPARLSADTQPKDVPEKKMSKTKKVAQFLSTTKQSSDFLDSRASESSAAPHARDDSRVVSEGGVDDLSVKKLSLKSGSGPRARVTLQDVKATLGRANTPHKSHRPSILSYIETTDNLSNAVRPDAGLSPDPRPGQNQQHAVSCWVSPETPSEQPLSTSSRHAELQPGKKEASEFKRAALISPSQMWPVSLNEGLKGGHHVTGLLSVSSPPPRISSPPHFPHTEQSVRAETLETLQLHISKQIAAEGATAGTRRGLGQVTLRDLPEWLACKTPSRPRDVVDVVQRGWRWYYRKYIDVKRGGVGGLGMLLAGYCVLSYIWSYPHIKLDRWRKYH